MGKNEQQTQQISRTVIIIRRRDSKHQGVIQRGWGRGILYPPAPPLSFRVYEYMTEEVRHAVKRTWLLCLEWRQE